MLKRFAQTVLGASGAVVAVRCDNDLLVLLHVNSSLAGCGPRVSIISYVDRQVGRRYLLPSFSFEA
jgi:hypothetical protein